MLHTLYSRVHNSGTVKPDKGQSALEGIFHVSYAVWQLLYMGGLKPF